MEAVVACFNVLYKYFTVGTEERTKAFSQEYSVPGSGFR
jgi:hypothetical protein